MKLFKLYACIALALPCIAIHGAASSSSQKPSTSSSSAEAKPPYQAHILLFGYPPTTPPYNQPTRVAEWVSLVGDKSKGRKGEIIDFQLHNDFLITYLGSLHSSRHDSNEYNVEIFDLSFESPYSVDLSNYELPQKFRGRTGPFHEDHDLLRAFDSNIKSALDAHAQTIRQNHIDAYIQSYTENITHFKSRASSLQELATAAYSKSILQQIRTEGKAAAEAQLGADLSGHQGDLYVQPHSIKEIYRLLPSWTPSKKEPLATTSPLRLYVDGLNPHKLLQPIDSRSSILENPTKIVMQPKGNYAVVAININPKYPPSKQVLSLLQDPHLWGNIRKWNDRDLDINTDWKAWVEDAYALEKGTPDRFRRYELEWVSDNESPRTLLLMIEPRHLKSSTITELESFTQRDYKDEHEAEFYRNNFSVLNMTPYPAYAALYTRPITATTLTKITRPSTTSASIRKLDAIIPPFARISLPRPRATYITGEQLLIAIDKTPRAVPNKERLNTLTPDTYNLLKSLPDSRNVEFQEFKLGYNNEGWDGVVVDVTYGKDLENPSIEFNEPFKFSEPQ